MTTSQGLDDGIQPIEPLDPVLLAETLAALADRLAAQEELLAVLLDERGASGTPSGPWAWHHLNPVQQEALLAELTDWVNWLVDRYQLGATRHQVPACWGQHPAAVEELTGLFVAWKAAYLGRSRDPSDGLIAWHDRWLWPCLTRLNEQLAVWNACRAGRHAPSSS